MTQRRPIPEKVRKLLSMMDSANDGEVLNAARAGGRILKGVGLSYRDLALAIPVHTSGPHLGGDNTPIRTCPPAAPHDESAVAYGRWRERRAQWAREDRERRSYTPRQEERQRAMARYCRDHDRGRLGRREQQFIRFVADAAMPRALTIRQGDWLSAITDRLDREDATWWQ